MAHLGQGTFRVPIGMYPEFITEPMLFAETVVSAIHATGLMDSTMID